MKIIRRFLSALALFLFCATSSNAADMTFYHGGFGYRARVESFREARFRDVVRQQYDFSCGSAALATLLHYHYGRQVSETEVLNAMLETGNKEKIRREGFSMLDMKKYLASLGLGADGYRMPLETLNEAGVPAVVLINSNGYLHFVVVKGLRPGLVLLADPALGTRVIERKDFDVMWNGILFVIRDDAGIAKASYNLAKDWNVQHKAAFGAALNDNALATMTIYATPTPNYTSF